MCSYSLTGFYFRSCAETSSSLANKSSFVYKKSRRFQNTHVSHPRGTVVWRDSYSEVRVSPDCRIGNSNKKEDRQVGSQDQDIL